MFKFKAKINGKWHKFNLHDISDGNVKVEGAYCPLPTVEHENIRLFSGKCNKLGEPIYFGDTLKPMYNNLSEVVATYESVIKYNVYNCKVIEDV